MNEVEMFGNRLLCGILGVVMVFGSADAAETRSHTLSLDYTQLALFSLKMFSKSVVESLEMGKPSRTYLAAMEDQRSLMECFSVSSHITNDSQKQYFIALGSIFNSSGPGVTDKLAKEIYSSAIAGSEDARSMLVAASKVKSFEEVITQSEDTTVSALEEKMQSICPSSDSDDESLDGGDMSGILFAGDKDRIDESELLSDHLFVSGMVCDLDEHIYSLVHDDESVKDLIRYEFGFLVRAGYDRGQLEGYIEDIKGKDTDLGAELRSLLS